MNRTEFEPRDGRRGGAGVVRMRAIRTIKIPDRKGTSRIDRAKSLENFRELHEKRTCRKPPEVNFESRDGYLIVSLKKPSPR